MKYKEINLNKKLFGDDFIVYDWKETADKITVYVKATSHEGICPVCGHSTTSLHNTYHRIVQAYPLNKKLHTLMSLLINMIASTKVVIEVSSCKIFHLFQLLKEGQII